ncbi:MAG TPA: ABC transporter permease [Amoebophilaceae bacterium]|jgi:lipoprotein-releasing system permease protein|nr:ABC transporter permease [Amoebophilaceae bacterium]
MVPFFQSICRMVWIAHRVTKRSKRIFSAAIHTIVMLSIAIGMASMLVAAMVMHGFEAEIKRKPTTFSGHLTITPRNRIHRGKIPQARQETPVLQPQMTSLLQQFSHSIERIHPFVQKPMLIHTPDAMEGIVCKGLDPHAYSTLQDFLQAGRLPNRTNSQIPQELCISTSLAQKLCLKVGSTVLMRTLTLPPRYRKLQVVGLYQTHLKAIDDQLAFCDMRLLQRLNQWTAESVSGYAIFLKEGMVPTPALCAAMRSLLDPSLQLIRADSVYAVFYHWLAIIQKNTTLFIRFILLVAGCTMVATAMIQLMERGYTMGVLKALGCPFWKIRFVLLVTSLRTLCWGMFWGNSLGLCLCWLQDHYKWLTLDPAVYYMQYVPISWDLPFMLGLNLFTLVSIGATLCATIWFLDKKNLVEALQESV